MDNIQKHFNPPTIRRKFLLAIIMLLSIPFTISAEPTITYSKIYLSPFYQNAMLQNVWYNYTVDITAPDGITNIKSAILTLDAWINPTRTFTAKMNGKYCMNNYTISTTYASAGRSVVTFDCSNAVIMNSINSVSLMVTGGNIGSSTSFIEITYENNPVGTLEIHGTEYTFGQTSKVWLQLLNSSGDYITSGVCYTDIYYPNSTELIERATMNNDYHDGIYYYDIVLPEVEGVYPTIALCYYQAGQTYNYATNYTLINATYGSGTLSNTYSSDGTYLNTNELTNVTPRRYASEFTFTNGSICNVSSQLLTGITIGWTGRWNSNVGGDYITISIYNYTSSTWIDLPNTITGVGTGSKTVTNSFNINNITSAGFVNSSGTNVKLRFIDTNITDSSSTGFDYDYLYVSCDQLTNPEWQSIKGSSELHLSQSINTTISSICNYTSRFDTIDNTLSVLNTTLYNKINDVLINITSQLDNIVTYILSIPYNTWTYTPRNLTYYEHIDLTNYTMIDYGVWNYTGRYTHGVILD